MVIWEYGFGRPNSGRSYQVAPRPTENRRSGLACLSDGGARPGDGAEARRRERVIATMGVMGAADALFLDVGHITMGGHLAVAASDASAAQRREANEANQTHHTTLP